MPLRKNRAILDFTTLKLYFAGPGDYNLESAMPPGTDTYQCELAPSGHMVLPCCEYEDNEKQSEGSLTLMAKPAASASSIGAPPGLPQRYQ